jgi:hypothetical protein
MTEQDPEIRDSPAYWFLVLERAREAGDFKRALEAKDNLERLGVSVRYFRPTKQNRQRTNADGRDGPGRDAEISVPPSVASTPAP